MHDTKQLVLIVEDDTALSTVLKERFDNEGFHVAVAKNGTDGLLMALEKHPAVILLDIMMPHQGGLDMLKELRGYEAGKDIPVMVLTNLSDSKAVHEALALGAKDYLVKADWLIADIVQDVRNLLKLPKV